MVRQLRHDTIQYFLLRLRVLCNRMVNQSPQSVSEVLRREKWDLQTNRTKGRRQ